MSEAALRAVAAAADSEAPREERARAVAQIIRDARGYRWVGVYDVGDGETGVVGFAQSPTAVRPDAGPAVDLCDEAVRLRSAVARNGVAVVPILGAESGIVIGMLDAVHEAGAFAGDDVEFLETCAALLRPVFD